MPIMLGVSFAFAPTESDECWALVLEVGIDSKHGLWGNNAFPKYLQRRLCNHFNVDLREINLDPHDPDLILRDGIKFIVDEAFLLRHYSVLPAVVEDVAQAYASQRDKPQT